MERRYDAYLLRWWRSDGGERAEIRHIRTGERVALPSLAAACAWLLADYGPLAAGPAPARPADEHDRPTGAVSPLG